MVVTKKIKSISHIGVHFPKLVKENTIQEIDNEWRALRNLNFVELGIDTENDVIEFGNKISKIQLSSGEAKFPNLTSLVWIDYS